MGPFLKMIIYYFGSMLIIIATNAQQNKMNLDATYSQVFMGDSLKKLDNEQVLYFNNLIERIALIGTPGSIHVLCNVLDQGRIVARNQNRSKQRPRRRGRIPRRRLN